MALASALRSNKEKDLWKHGALGGLEDLSHRLAGVDVLDLAEAGIHVNDGPRELLEGPQTLLQSLFIVVLPLDICARRSD